MAVSSRAELVSALSVDNAALLLGTPESLWLDFKRDPYLLDTPRGKWELAKDVAAFANATGGMIVLGVTAERRPHEVVEVAVAVPGVRRDLVNPQQYLDTIADRLRPAVDVHLHWMPAIDREEGLFFIIEVEESEHAGAVVLRRMIDEDDRHIEALGLPRRRGDRVEWATADEVSHLLREGLRPRSQPLEHPAGNTAIETARADQRLDDVEAWQEWSDLPVYYIQAIPPVGTSLVASLLERDGLRGALEHVDCLRPMGWNLRTDGYSEVRDGALAYLRDSRRAIVIDPNGLFTVAAVADSDYLGWAQGHPGPEHPYVIHPLSLVEFTFEATRFLHTQLVPRSRPGAWTLRIACRRFSHGNGVALRPGPMSTWYGLDDPRPATADAWKQEFESTGDAPGDAFQALFRVYMLFGLDSSAIPYRDGERISAEAITAVT